ncbi:hypothetical protein [Halostella pelagica]|uniref:hypothetical protein n=1 Tax=Halostella pelagica TaxID=2583824 RepID=UPI001386BA49|nr:hypothetical protein [Halostella pelagica]
MREEDVFFGAFIAAPFIALLAPTVVYLAVGFEASVVVGITILIFLRMSGAASE